MHMYSAGPCLVASQESPSTSAIIYLLGLGELEPAETGTPTSWDMSLCSCIVAVDHRPYITATLLTDSREQASTPEQGRVVVTAGAGADTGTGTAGWQNDG